MPEFKTEIREAFEKKYVKVFLKKESMLNETAEFLRTLNCTHRVNITENKKTDLTVYPAKVYSAEEAEAEIIEALNNLFLNKPQNIPKKASTLKQVKKQEPPKIKKPEPQKATPIFEAIPKKGKAKYKDFFLRIWRDSVFSKVIATFLIALLTWFFGTFIFGLFQTKQIEDLTCGEVIYKNVLIVPFEIVFKNSSMEFRNYSIQIQKLIEEQKVKDESFDFVKVQILDEYVAIRGLSDAKKLADSQNASMIIWGNQRDSSIVNFRFYTSNPSDQRVFNEVKNEYVDVNESTVDYFKEMVFNKGVLPEFYLLRGKEYYEKENYECAIVDAENALKLNSNLLGAYVLKIKSLLKGNKNKEAYKILEKATSLFPQKKALLLELIEK